MISIGQLMFKRVSLNLNQSNDFLSYGVFGTFTLAIIIYGFATIFWIYLLKTIPLNQAYSFMALSFIFVTLGSVFFFGEKITINFILGLSLIIIGLLIIANSY